MLATAVCSPPIMITAIGDRRALDASRGVQLAAGFGLGCTRSPKPSSGAKLFLLPFGVEVLP